MLQIQNTLRQEYLYFFKTINITKHSIIKCFNLLIIKVNIRLVTKPIVEKTIIAISPVYYIYTYI